MTPTTRATIETALANPDPTTRLRVAMHAGSHPDPALVATLVRRCALEPDFFVRDMLTWALTRHPVDAVVPMVLAELDKGEPRARSQALHTLTKIPDVDLTDAWPQILRLVDDSDDEVATTAWRAAVVAVPTGQEDALVRALLGHLGRGGGERRRRLSRALAALSPTADGVLRQAMTSADGRVADHAALTVRLIDDPDAGVDDAVREARRVAVMGSDADR